MASITALNVRLGMDASNFSQGVELARSEVNKVASIMRQSVPPAEKFKSEIELLDKAFSAAGKQSRQYAAAVEHLKRKHGQAEDSAEKLRRQIALLPGPLGTAASRAEGMAAQLGAVGAMSGPTGVALAGVAAGAIAIGGAATAVVKFHSEMTRAREAIDEQSKAAARLGMSYREMMGLMHAASEVSGASAGQMEAAIKQLQIRAAKAVEGDQKITAAFAKVGIDAGKALEGGPLEAFKRISKGMESVDNHAERLRLTTELFGKSGADVVSLLTAGSDVLEESIAFQEKWNGLTSAQVLGVEAANDAMARLQTAGQGFTNMLAADTAPLVEMMAKDLLSMVSGFERMDSFTKGIAESMAMGMGDVKDYMEAFSVLSELPKKTWKLDFGGAADVLRDAFAFDKGPQQYMELLKRRGELEFDAAEAARKRDSERGVMSDEAAADAQLLVDAYNKQLESIERQILALNEGEAAVRQMGYAADKLEPQQIEQLERQHKLLDTLKEEQERRKKIADEARRATEEQERQVKLAEATFTKDIETALGNARKFFEDERKRDATMRSAVAKGPETFEVGSAGAAKFMADQVNASIGASMPDRPTPGEAEIIAQAVKLFTESQKQTSEAARQTAEIKRLVTTIESNAVRRAR